MKLLKQISFPDGSVEVKLLVGSTEDLWHLFNLIVPSDHVKTRTKRKVVKETAMTSHASDVKTLVLEIEVSKIDFSPEEVRIQGINKTESEYIKLGAFHTFSIFSFPPHEVSIMKSEWNSISKERLREACDQEAKADTVALLMDYGSASLVLITPSLMHVKAKVEISIAKKHKNDGSARDKSIQRFFKHVLEAITTHVEFQKIKLLLIGSPGYVREEFFNFLKSTTQNTEVESLRTIGANLKKIILVKVPTNTLDGLREAFKNPTIVQQMDSVRCADDIKVWDTFHSTMSTDSDRCVYTSQFVFEAAIVGAIGTLMVSDCVFRSINPIERRFYLSLVHLVKKSGAKARIFSSNHITGEQLDQLGSVAAILHYPCPELNELEVVPDFLSSSEVQKFISGNSTVKVTVS